MRLTKAHVDFWSYHRRPSWAGRVTVPRMAMHAPSVHACINDHANVGPLGSLYVYRKQSAELSNAFALIRRPNGAHGWTRLECMRTIIKQNHSTSADRIKWYRRWLRRYAKSIGQP